MNIYNPDNLPVIEPLPARTVGPADGAVAICGKCGMRILPVMGYVCGSIDCPVFQKFTC